MSLFGQKPKKKRKRKGGGSRGSIARAWNNCEDSDNSDDDYQVQETVGHAMILSGSLGT